MDERYFGVRRGENRVRMRKVSRFYSPLKLTQQDKLSEFCTKLFGEPPISDFRKKFEIFPNHRGEGGLTQSQLKCKFGGRSGRLELITAFSENPNWVASSIIVSKRG